MNSSELPAPLSRRSFLKQSAAATAVCAATSLAAEDSKPKVIDCHAHLHHHSRKTWEIDDRGLIEAADKLGIDQLCCSILTPRRPATVVGFQECNQWAAEAQKRYPGRVLPWCYVNPGFQKEAAEEVRRCVEERGFIGVKLYNEFTCTNPIVFPIVELTIKLKVPILHHAGHTHYFLDEQPHISDGGHLAELGRRYPQARIICAHICGGGDWEWTIKALRGVANVSLDTSGSVTDDGVVEMAVRELGADRIMFACDMSMTASVGRMRAAQLSPADKRKILGENMAKLLGRRQA